MYNDITDDKLDFVNNLIDIIDTAIRTNKINPFKDDILKSINNSMVADIKEKHYNNEKYTKKDKKKLIITQSKKLINLKSTIENNIKSVNKKMRELPKDLQLKLSQLNNIDIIINELINVIWHELHEKKRRGQRKIKVNKIKDTKGYVNELTLIVSFKLTMIKTFYSKLDDAMPDIQNKIKNKESTDEIISYLESYKKRLKTISDYLSNSIKTLMQYEVINKPNKSKQTKKSNKK